MLITHENGKDYKKAVQEAISKATAISKDLKTFEIEAEPAVKEITKDGATVTDAKGNRSRQELFTVFN